MSNNRRITANNCQKHPHSLTSTGNGTQSLLIGVGRAFRDQDVRDPRLGFARPPKATPYAGGRPDPSKNYAGGRRVYRVGSTRRYVEGGNADTSGFSETHDRLADPTARYLLEEEKQPESTQRPERPGTLRAFDGPTGFHCEGEEYVTKPEITVEELARAWDIAGRVNGNGHARPEQPWSKAERRQRQQRLGEKNRLLFRGCKLRLNERLPWDTITKRLSIPRTVVREQIAPDLCSVLGPSALALRRELIRDEYGQIVGEIDDE